MLQLRLRLLPLLLLQDLLPSLIHLQPKTEFSSRSLQRWTPPLPCQVCNMYLPLVQQPGHNDPPLLLGSEEYTACSFGSATSLSAIASWRTEETGRQHCKDAWSDLTGNSGVSEGPSG